MAIKERRDNLKTDKDLSETLKARRTKLALNGNTVRARKDGVIEEEKLDIVPNMFVTSEDVHRQGHSFASRFEDEKMRKEQQKRARKLTARKFFETFICAALIIAIGFMAILLMYPQTEISEIARDNSDLKDQINGLKTQILDAEENAHGVTDMDTVRAQALALGMQDPNQNQVISLPVPNNDSLKTVVTYNMDGINAEALENAQNALATYYAEHP
ncbi:MAG: hypothetical protein K5745_07005 [Saccharofermentans sp.]|nr:hypothetical protein [Saccharofermentans sp.]